MTPSGGVIEVADSPTEEVFSTCAAAGPAEQSLGPDIDQRPPNLWTGGRNVPENKTSPIRLMRPLERRSLSRSATRALDVLEYFGQERRPLRAIEIVRALDLHPSTTNQLLKTMAEAGHLVFDARTMTYFPSYRFAPFGAWIVQTYGADERLHRLVIDVQDQTDQLVMLTAPNDLCMQIVEVAGVWPGSAIIERGMRWPIFGTVSGAAYLSSLDNGEITRLAQRAGYGRSEANEIVLDVDNVRQDGFAEGRWGDGEFWTLAVPLKAKALRPLVLAVVGKADRVLVQRAEIKALFRRALKQRPEH